MPAVGFGTWQAKDEVLAAALETALEAGYRHIDTAAAYENEHVIGDVLNKWLDSGRLKREDIFITTKLPIYGNRPDEVSEWINSSLTKLKVSQIDLYLVHLPVGAFKTPQGLVIDKNTDLLAVWKEMEKLVDSGKTRYIGVSNFNEKQVGRILANCRIPPVTNQVELHAYLQQNELVDYLKKNNVTITAYSSLGTPGSEQMFKDVWGVEIKVPKILENPTVLEVAQKNGKTPAQVLLRHILQRGIVVIPKSTSDERIRLNYDIQNWKLDDDDMAKLNALNKNARILEFKDIIKGTGDHPEYPF